MSPPHQPLATPFSPDVTTLGTVVSVLIWFLFACLLLHTDTRDSPGFPLLSDISPVICLILCVWALESLTVPVECANEEVKLSQSLDTVVFVLSTKTGPRCWAITVLHRRLLFHSALVM